MKTTALASSSGTSVSFAGEHVPGEQRRLGSKDAVCHMVMISWGIGFICGRLFYSAPPEKHDIETLVCILQRRKLKDSAAFLQISSLTAQTLISLMQQAFCDMSHLFPR